MKPSQQHITCQQALCGLRLCFFALVIAMFGIQTGTAGSLDLQAPKSEPQPVTVNEDGEADESDSTPGEANPEKDPASADNEDSDPLAVPPGYAAGSSFSPQYQSNGFLPLNPEGQPVFGPTFNQNLVGESEATDSDSDESELVEEDTPGPETVQAPGPVERPLPPDPGVEYDALLLQKQTGAPAVRQ